MYVLHREEYLKYKPIAESFEETTLKKFKEKKIKKLYIPEEQEADYLKFLDNALESLEQRSNPLASRAAFAADTMNQEADQIGKALDNENNYKQSEARITKVVDFLLGEPKALVSMLASAGHSVDTSQHSSTVSNMALAMAAHMKASKEELMDIAVAALLHDSGLAKLGFSSGVNYSSLSKEQKAKFKTHPAEAMEQISGKKFIQARVLRLIQDHEEYGEGLGYPDKKWYKSLSLDSQIFNLADALDHHAMIKGKTPAEALEDFINERGDHFEFQLLEILEKKIKA